jgi:hypothetical protein
MTNEDVEGEHPLFRAMVLMGSSLAVGCGGNTSDIGQGRHIDDPRGTGGSPNGGSAARSPEDAGVASHPVIIMPNGTGASPTSEAGANGGAGGRMSGTGGVTVGTGGTVSAGGAAPLACPPSQLDCPTSAFDCDPSTSTWTSEVACKCNSGRPKTAADCPPGKTFVCLAGASENAGPVPFACKCMPDVTDCNSACISAFSPDADVSYQCAPSPENQFLCGCAFALLR